LILSEMNLVEKILQGDPGSTAKLISKIEDEPGTDFEEIRILEAKGTSAYTVGITGSSGVGKSSLIARLIEQYRKNNKKVAVLAIDPSSPFTGGAILGDRIRMQMHSLDEGVFIRSMSTRGHLGGLSQAAANTIKVMAAWGADTVIVETVGVGQDEVEIIKVADTILVVLSPGSGDDIQMMKAGILEVGDIFVINKADRPEAENLKGTLESVNPGRKDEGWQPCVIETIALKGSGIEELYEKIEEHRKYTRKKEDDK